MDPFTVGTVALLVAGFLRAGKKREAGRLILDKWDESLAPKRGKVGERITIPKRVREALVWVKGGCACEGRGDIECDDGDLEIDHRIPLARGGSNYSDNLDPVCHRHQKWKKTRIGRRD